MSTVSPQLATVNNQNVRHVSLVDGARIPPPLESTGAGSGASRAEVCRNSDAELGVVEWRCVSVGSVVAPVDEGGADDGIRLQVDNTEKFENELDA